LVGFDPTNDDVLFHLCVLTNFLGDHVVALRRHVFVAKVRLRMDDPQFIDRFQWLAKEQYDADLLPFPVKWIGAALAPPAAAAAPAIGERTADVSADVAGYDDAQIRALRNEGVLERGTRAPNALPGGMEGRHLRFLYDLGV
jgi:hypothetical protein